jgi:Lrp/AsnC family transcriptional regulator, regulator for asnA, asnC and gidA
VAILGQAMTDRSASPSELDELDLRIIGQLQDDGRKPTTEIARALRVPRTTVARRIERLVRDKIATIGVFANGPKIGLQVHAMILLEVTPTRYDAVVSEIVGLDAVRWVGIMSGPFDVMIEAMLPSSDDLRHLLLESFLTSQLLHRPSLLCAHSKRTMITQMRPRLRPDTERD